MSWLQEDRGLVVLLDKNGLNDIGVSPAEPISDRLTDDPIYLLLNRLRSLGLAWYFAEDIVYITSSELADERATTLPYNVGDLLDAGYDLDTLTMVITATISPESWDQVGGPGVLNSLGDVLFVRQNDPRQREVKALLQALRGHGRQTFLNDPTQHLLLRQKLRDDISVDFQDTPLETAVSQLADIAKIDIRLDVPALRDARVREREPISLKLADRKLATVLQAIVLELDLTWILRDGVLWITSPEEAEGFLRTAVYDVRDLCRDEDESEALIDAIMAQADPDSWDEVGGPGAIESAKAGTLVITHQEQVHDKVLDLLETYRSALRSSKPRERDAEDPDDVKTVYYRLHSNVVRDLSVFLPKFVQTDSWKSAQRPDAPGEIFIVASTPDLSAVGSLGAVTSNKKPAAASIVIARSVLIVRQTRAVHDEIEEIIRRVEAGDAVLRTGGGMGGGGGFGGGFFSIESK